MTGLKAQGRHWAPLPVAMLVGAAVWWLRHGFVEREGLAVACLDDGSGLVCALRAATETAMSLAPLHAVALAAGLLALFARRAVRRAAIWVAASAGPAALALGDATFGGTGLLLALVALSTHDLGDAQAQPRSGDQQGGGRPAESL
jgi:hypothetical protein